MRTRSTIVAGAIAGMALIGTAGQALAGTAFAEPTPPVPQPDTTLDVTLTPSQGGPGDAIKIAATGRLGSITDAVATSPVLGTVSLQSAGKTASGTGQILKDAKAGVYPVTVNAKGIRGLKLQGGARLTVVVVTPSPTPSEGTTTPTPTPTTTIPSGGVGTGGGGTAGGADLALISAGSAVALLGIAAAVAAMRRRQDDVDH